MKRIGLMMTGMLLAAGMLLSSSFAAETGETVNAETIAQHLDKTKYTTTEVKNYLKELKDKQVVAQGKVEEVFTGRSGIKVVLSVDVPKKAKDFVVDALVEEAASLHKGDRITCTGKYVKYNPITLNGITIKGTCKK